jgi:hypothetical protein
MEKELKKQSRFFYGGKNELLQLLCIFPHHTVCNSYSEISSYYPCIYLGQEWRYVDEQTIFFIVSEKKPEKFFINVSQQYLKQKLCEFFNCFPNIESNEPLASFIYKFSISPKKDVAVHIPVLQEEPMYQIITHIRKTEYIRDSANKIMWLRFLKKVRYGFLKTGNRTLGNYISFVKRLIENYSIVEI